jgi:hypothetical protein
MVRELGGEVEHLLSLGVDEALALRRLDVNLNQHAIKRGPGRRPKEPKGERRSVLLLLYANPIVRMEQ